METESPVYGLDALRTTEDAEATIRLLDGTEIALQENSLVILAFDEGERRIEFLGGAITAKSGEAADVVISTGDTKIGLEGSIADIRSTSGGETTVAALGGALSVQSKDGSIQKVGAAEEARISAVAAQVVEAPFVLLAPANGEVLITANEAGSVPLAWKTAFSESILELSKSKDFSSIDSVRRVSGNSASVVLAPGVWYWRLRRDGETPSRSNRFTLQRIEPALPLSPVDGLIVRFLDELPFVRLNWEAPRDAVGVDWELSADSAFASIMQSGRSGSDSAMVGPLEPGTYYWRVRSVYAGTDLGPGAIPPARRFTVERSAALSPPQLISPVDGFGFLHEEIQRERALLTWRPERDAAGFLVQISDDATFATVTRFAVVDAPSYPLPPEIGAGRHYWRIIALDAASKTNAGSGIGASSQSALSAAASEPSAVRFFEVAPAAQAFALEAPGDAYRFAASRGRPLSWRGDANQRYRVVVLNEENGERVVEQEVVGNTLVLPDLEPARYRWTVAPADAVDRVLSRGFVVADPLPAPSVISPNDGAVLTFINSSSIEFAWGEIPRAELYRFVLIDQTGRKLAEADTAENSFRIEPVPPAGTYRWTVTARRAAEENADELIGKTGAYGFSVNSVRSVESARQISPAQNARIAGLDALRSGVPFRFEPAEQGAETTVLLAADAEFSRILARRSTRAKSLTIARLQPGAYFWKLVSVSAEGIALPESAVFRFEIERIPLLPAPEIVSPRQGEKVDMSEAEALVLSWRPVSGATSYDASLTDASGRVVWSAGRLGETEVRISELERLDIGNFVLTVRATSYDNKGALERGGREAKVAFTIHLGPVPAKPDLISPRRIYVP